MSRKQFTSIVEEFSAAFNLTVIPFEDEEGFSLIAVFDKGSDSVLTVTDTDDLAAWLDAEHGHLPYSPTIPSWLEGRYVYGYDF